MKAPIIVSTAFVSLLAFSGTALAECAIDKNHKELSVDEVAEHYSCIRSELISKYQSGDDPSAKEYTAWKAGATGPAAPGFHSGRYLMTYVNDIGHSTYIAYATSGVDFPVGTKIAKESYKIKKGGKIKPGPLFFMEKVGVDKAPKTNGWAYSTVSPKGKLKTTGLGFCHGCHQAYLAQDAAGYPAPEVRFK